MKKKVITDFSQPTRLISYTLLIMLKLVQEQICLSYVAMQTSLFQ